MKYSFHFGNLSLNISLIGTKNDILYYGLIGVSKRFILVEIKNGHFYNKIFLEKHKKLLNPSRKRP